MGKHTTSIPHPWPRYSEEWLLEPMEQLTRRGDADTTSRLVTDDGSVLLTDLQRAGLKWLSSFD